jgi:3-hydroxybutyryl-CoA dehydrogenase
LEINKIGVVGAGTMGNGIAHVAAQSGFEVVLVDVDQKFLDKAVGTIKKNLGRQLEKGKLTQEQMDGTLGKIKTAASLEAVKDCGIVVEAVFEDLKVKKDIFVTLDALCPPEAILATNTSTISITLIASATNRPDKVIGMHFMNPVPMMQLVEVIKGVKTSEATYQIVDDLAKKMGKTPVLVNDYPGFVANRVLQPMINEACYCLMEGVATPEAIDTVMKLGANHPLGPLALADLIGLDVCLAILEVLYTGFSDSKYRPCPLLKKMVAAGHLGRKTGQGFYKY